MTTLATPPTMTLEGVQYVEAPEQDEDIPCDGCAFWDTQRLCSKTLPTATLAFGGGCGTRAVIYLAQPSA